MDQLPTPDYSLWINETARVFIAPSMAEVGQSLGVGAWGTQVDKENEDRLPDAAVS